MASLAERAARTRVTRTGLRALHEVGEPPRHRRLDRIVVKRPGARTAVDRFADDGRRGVALPSESASEVRPDVPVFDAAARGVVLATLLGAAIWIAVGIATATFVSSFFG